MKYSKTHPLITGTLVLTGTGLLSRLIGFFYRIYLARLFGEEGMGLYQLIGPVLSVSFALTAAGFQTTISRLIARQTSAGKLHPFFLGLCLSLPLSFLFSAVVFWQADTISTCFLSQEKCAGMLRILAFSIPLSSLHSCVNGYFYGKKETAIPAFSQLLEQFTRVGCVYLLSSGILGRGGVPDISLAVFGLALGELASSAFSIIALILSRKKSDRFFTLQPVFSGELTKDFLTMLLPLSANRLSLTVLSSIEAVSIPVKLREYGLDNPTVLSIYGVLTGMALPLLFFPNALTGSLSVMLLPTISESQANRDFAQVRRNTCKTIYFCGGLGILCMLLFTLFGKWLGSFLFESDLAGYYLSMLGFLCPFLYTNTTLSGILQGLGKAGSLFAANLAALFLRLSFVFLGIPRFGIRGYFYGLLFSHLLQTIALTSICFHTIKKESRLTS
ncbi:MAG: polysaccharide biosynthesis protein [Acetatifactor sp.]